MAIDLPDYPAPASVTPALMDFGSVLQPGLGGPTQKINRLGNRFSISVTMPAMKVPKLGRIWLSRLIQAQTQGARMRWPLQGVKSPPVSSTGIKIADGGQTGSTLICYGGVPNAVYKEGQFFSILTNGRHHLYMLTDEVIFNVEGTAPLPIAPMLRVNHGPSDSLFFDPPFFEGILIGDRREWEWSIANFVGLQFEIQETH